MTNVEYLEMTENGMSDCTHEFKNCMYLRSIARSLAVIADSLDPRDPREKDKEVDEIKLSDLCFTCKNYRNGKKTVDCKAYITPEFSCYEEKLKDEEDPEGAYWKLEKFGVSCCSCGSYVALKYDASSDSIKPEDAYCPHCGKKWKGEKK